MNKVALSGTVRTATGTKDAAQLRREKRVPCVLYGSEQPVHFSVEENALRSIVFTPEVNTVEIDLEGRTVQAMLHQKQFHPVTDRVLHLDFLQVQEGKDARATLSVRLLNQPIGVRKGGKLNHNMRKLRVKGLPDNIPSHLDVDVENLDINQSLRVSDLKYEGLTILDKPGDVVVAVKMVKKKEDPAAAAPGAPAEKKK